MALRRAPRRYILLGVGLGVLALAIAGGTWLAVARPQFEKVGPGLMTVAPGGGPLMTYSRPGQPAQAVMWREMKGTPLKVEQVQIKYAYDDGTPVTAYITVAEDASGQRWLQAVRGSDPLVPSPDRSCYFFDHYGQLYLVDTKTLEVSPLSSWEYQGKSRLQLIKEQNRPIGWVAHPLWTPDGRSVVFVTDRSGEYELWRLDLATREESVVARCGPDRFWALHCWAADGRLLADETSMSNQATSELFLLDLATGAIEQLLRTVSFDVSGPYIYCRSLEPDAGRVLYDINRRRSAPVPPAPEGYTYSMPMCVSPRATRVALWLQTMDGKRLVGVIDMSVDPPALQTYEPPGGPRGAGALMWIDEDTVAVQSGDKNDPAAATYALKVGEGK